MPESTPRTNLDGVVPLPALQTLLVAFDQSNQDQATLAAAAEIAIRSNSSEIQAFTTFAYRGGPEPRREEYLDVQSASLENTAGIPTSRLPEVDAPTDPYIESHEQIIGWAVDKSADLIIFPAPYLKDFWKLGKESAGPTFHALVRHSMTPLFVIREPPRKGDPALPADVLFPIIPNTHTHTAAASWALHLVRPGATLQILAVLSEKAEAPDSLTSLVGMNIEHKDLSAEARDELANLAGSDFPDIFDALQRGAAAKNARCVLSIRSGDFVKAATAVVTGTVYPKIRPKSAPIHRAITVLGYSPDPDNEAHQLCAELIRNLSGPALISTK